ncbi:MAG: hypothetical protein K6A65_02025 [Succinivibrionaceae bacterium]|nr:hypothetical protein [Succinivibrionaceae bacterium]
MLKGISPLISPGLLHAMARMGHGDTMVLADANFPAHSMGRGIEVVRADGLPITALLTPILSLFPLDHASPAARVMQVTPQDRKAGITTPVWDEYRRQLSAAGYQEPLVEVERFDFYRMSRESFVIVLTGETALYGNLALTKGVVSPP